VLPDPLTESLEEATVQLYRIGYDRVAGALAGGMASIAAAGTSVAAYPTTTIEAVHGETAAGRSSFMLDVRDPQEWRDEGVAPGALRIPLGDLPAQMAAIPRDGPVTVMCRSGARASIAASLLDAAGYDVRLVAQGGAPDWPGAREAGAAAETT
jgi:hydroxyacylglutathione hydrolase